MKIIVDLQQEKNNGSSVDVAKIMDEVRRRLDINQGNDVLPNWDVVPASPRSEVGNLTDERIAVLYSQAQEQGLTGIAPSVHFARAIEKELLGNTLKTPRGAMNLEGFVFSQWCSIFKKTEYNFFKSAEMAKHGHTLICPYTIEFDLPPDFNAVSSAVAEIKAEQSVLHKEFAKKNQVFESQLQDLLCLTHETK